LPKFDYGKREEKKEPKPRAEKYEKKVKFDGTLEK
jgi:hypothetical protein